MSKVKILLIAIGCSLLVIVAIIDHLAGKTSQRIAHYQNQVIELSKLSSMHVSDSNELEQLPAPVKRYFEFVFKGTIQTQSYVHIEAKGDFRRPMADDFARMNAEQVIAIGTPALMFSGTTDVAPFIWATAYDYFANGKMEMKAKLLSAYTVVDEQETPELNRISLRRWLLESPLYPQALLPGGMVKWEAIDESSARAIIEQGKMRTSMIADFDSKGRLTQMYAEEPGDLNTPYHGSGEHVSRDDYQSVNGVMIPHKFVISRSDGTQIYPFWKGEITKIAFY